MFHGHPPTTATGTPQPCSHLGAPGQPQPPTSKVPHHSQRRCTHAHPRFPRPTASLSPTSAGAPTPTLSPPTPAGAPECTAPRSPTPTGAPTPTLTSRPTRTHRPSVPHAHRRTRTHRPSVPHTHRPTRTRCPSVSQSPRPEAVPAPAQPHQTRKLTAPRAHFQPDYRAGEAPAPEACGKWPPQTEAAQTLKTPSVRLLPACSALCRLSLVPWGPLGLRNPRAKLPTSARAAAVVFPSDRKGDSETRRGGRLRTP